MFLNDLFTILSETTEGAKSVFTIKLNREHPIFSGHFPGSPITPGVCIVQMAVDLFAYVQGKTCRLAGAKNIKFLQIIKPEERDEVEYQLSWEPVGNDDFKVKAVVCSGEIVFAKMSLQIAC